jgi:hypothetical protein
VVNGFQRGEWNEVGQYLVVRQRDAHSWADVYFPGAGWVPAAASQSTSTPCGGDGIGTWWTTTWGTKPPWRSAYDNSRWRSGKAWGPPGIGGPSRRFAAREGSGGATGTSWRRWPCWLRRQSSSCAALPSPGMASTGSAPHARSDSRRSSTSACCASCSGAAVRDPPP